MKKIIIFFVALLIIVFLFILLYKRQPAKSGVDISQADLIIFWGEGCPHCEKVFQFITDNLVENKVKISYKEVSKDVTNKQLLSQTVKQCPEINTDQGIGVPLAFDQKSQKCLYGDQPIIDWLSPMIK